MVNNEQAIVVSYYLSRFNDEAVNNLGYKTWKDAFPKSCSHIDEESKEDSKKLS